MATGNPNIAEFGKNTQFGKRGGCGAVEAQRKSAAKRSANKDVAKMVMEKMDADQLASVILKKANTGDIKFMELALKLASQMPADKVETTITAANPMTQMSAEELKDIYYGGKD